MPTPPFASVTHIFLDRDGVINVKLNQHQYVTRPEDFKLCPGVAAAVALLNRRGIKVIVVTNQRGIALGIFLGRATCDGSSADA